MNTLLVVFVGSGVLLVALAVPLIRRNVPPNGWYGLRVSATFADERVWYEANARSGRDLLVFGVVQTVLAVVLRLLEVSENVYALAGFAVLVGGAIVFAIVGVRRANQLLAYRKG